MIQFHFLHVTPKQDYLHSIHFYAFPFLYFKTSNQGYLIPFHFILFHSSPLLKCIPFYFIPLWSFHFILLWTPKRSLNLCIKFISLFFLFIWNHNATVLNPNSCHYYLFYFILLFYYFLILVTRQLKWRKKKSVLWLVSWQTYGKWNIQRTSRNGRHWL